MKDQIRTHRSMGLSTVTNSRASTAFMPPSTWTTRHTTSDRLDMIMHRIIWLTIAEDDNSIQWDRTGPWKDHN